MSVLSPLLISQQMLTALGTKTFFYHQDRVPADTGVLIVSNHRSFMDAPLLMAATNRSVNFACHHYMGQVPVLRELVTRLGCFPLDAPEQRQHGFFDQATQLLRSRQVVGIFPEGAQPMVKVTPPQDLTPFHRGFAHLALRAPIQDLVVLPVAIAPHQETVSSLFPLKFLSWFDPSEPLFDQGGWHPLIVYQRVSVLVGRPVWITPAQRQAYQGKQAKVLVTDLTERCKGEIDTLLRRGHWD